NTPPPPLTTDKNEKSGDSSIPPTDFTMTSPMHITTTTVGTSQTTTIPGTPLNTTTVRKGNFTPSQDSVPNSLTPDPPKTDTLTQLNPGSMWEDNPWHEKSRLQLPPTDTNLMDTESNATIEPNDTDPQPRTLYSQVHKRKTKHIPRTDEEWYTAILR
ncbi:17740_t:CDS:1, partial [Gigaspora rosea]